MREFKNSSADAKASAVYPNDFMSPLIASRIDSSSSTTEIRGFAFGTSTPSCGFPRGRTRCDPGHSAGIFDCISEDKTKPGGPRLYFGLKQNCREGERGGRPSILAKVKKPFSYDRTILGYSGSGIAAALRVAVPLLQRTRAMTAQPTIIIVDDDPGIRESLESLMRSVGLQVKALASVPEFVIEGRPEGPACLVLDVRLPGRSGLDFQRELSVANIHVPIIFITGHGDIPMSVQAIKGGAIEFLTKPFRDQDLLDAIQLGLARDRMWLENEKAIAALRARFETLTPREREVMALVVTGRLNKRIAYDIGISEITVKVHRGQVMRKMQAASLPDLARMADKLNFTAEKSPSC
ncbi:MAG TPA: response regulator transcription factor [Stellaceae bacterium]|nr:response regulator transcription factor [Stellaceae bacterium]